MGAGRTREGVFRPARRRGFVAEFARIRARPATSGITSRILANSATLKRPGCAERAFLLGGDFVDADLAQFEQPVQLVTAKCGLFARALDFNELTGAGHYHVEIDLGV